MTIHHDEPDVSALLAPLDSVEPAVMKRLRDRLAAVAAEQHTLDIACRTVDSPIGKLLLAATERGMVRVAFEMEDHDAVLQFLAEKLSPRILFSASRLDPAARELDEYFAGIRQQFDLPLDFSFSRGFRLSVLEHLPQIAYGHTESYAQVALAAGNPLAVRAVGTACATNPLPVIVPCHRVVKSDGSLGNYLGGTEAKRTLLALEAA